MNADPIVALSYIVDYLRKYVPSVYQNIPLPQELLNDLSLLTDEQVNALNQYLASSDVSVFYPYMVNSTLSPTSSSSSDRNLSQNAKSSDGRKSPEHGKLEHKKSPEHGKPSDKGKR